jgi:hypothetical protein
VEQTSPRITLAEGDITQNDHLVVVSVTTQDPDVNIVYVDVTAQFAQHGIGSPVPFINATGPDAFHPNAAGYRAYADAIFDALSGDG